jgi:hypothetical protein
MSTAAKIIGKTADARPSESRTPIASRSLSLVSVQDADHAQRSDGWPREESAMPGSPAALARHHERLDEIGEVSTKYGFAAWVQRGSGLVSARLIEGLVDRYVDPEIVAMSDGERLRRALTELGTTWIKFSVRC